MSTYANLRSTMGYQFDEVRYQTIGRGHGFSELEGVPFKLAEKYQSSIQVQPSNMTQQLADLRLDNSGVLTRASEYTFDLERKVLENLQCMWS